MCSKLDDIKFVGTGVFLQTIGLVNEQTHELTPIAKSILESVPSSYRSNPDMSASFVESLIIAVLLVRHGVLTDTPTEPSYDYGILSGEKEKGKRFSKNIQFIDMLIKNRLFLSRLAVLIPSKVQVFMKNTDV